MSEQNNLEKLNKQLDLIAAGQPVATEDELLKGALLIAELKAVTPQADYRQETKAKLLQRAAELKAAKEKQAASRWLKPKRWLAAVAFAFLLSSGSVVYAANGAMPDSWLYPIKQAVEKVALSMPLSRSLKAKIKLAVAKRKLAEAKYLQKKNKDKAAKHLLKRYQRLLKETGLIQPGSSFKAPQPQGKKLNLKRSFEKNRLKEKPVAPKLRRQPAPNNLRQNLKPVLPPQKPNRKF